MPMSFILNEKEEHKENEENNEEDENGVIPMEISTDDDTYESKLRRKNKNSSSQTNSLEQLQQKQQQKEQQKQQQLSFKPFLSHQNQIHTQSQFQNQNQIQQRKILKAKRFEIPKFNWFGSNNADKSDTDDMRQNYDANDDNISSPYLIKKSSNYPSPYSPNSPMYSPSYSPSSPGWMPNPESKQDLVNHIKSNLREISDVQDFQQKVKGANFYTGYHDSDLHSEETDLSKFFNIYTPVSDTTNMLNNLKCGKNDSSCKESLRPILDNQTGNPVSFDEGSDGTPMYRRDTWNYANERPMSGGDVDGILPSDNYQEGYATYPANKQMFDSSYHNSYPYMESTGRW